MYVILKIALYCNEQLVRSNSRRSMPLQTDEEAHQLSYLQKQIGNIISLLADTVEGEGGYSLVCLLTLRMLQSYYIIDIIF